MLVEGFNEFVLGPMEVLFHVFTHAQYKSQNADLCRPRGVGAVDIFACLLIL